MSASVKWDGLAELRQALRDLPEALTGEAVAIVQGHATIAAEKIRNAYPRRTGNLRKGVVVTHLDGGKYSTGAIVENRAKHAYIFENGTEARHNDLGAFRGSMPPGHVFVPAIIRERRAMYDDLWRLLEEHGLVVSGSEDAA